VGEFMMQKKDEIALAPIASGGGIVYEECQKRLKLSKMATPAWTFASHNPTINFLFKPYQMPLQRMTLHCPSDEN
jgi:hypothetical protein